MSDEYNVLPVELRSVSPDAIKPERRKLTRTYTVQLAHGGGDSPKELLPYNPDRCEAHVQLHSGGAADTHSSNGWISDSRAAATAGDVNAAFYIAASTPPLLPFKGATQLFVAADPGSTVDLWISVADTYYE